MLTNNFRISPYLRLDAPVGRWLLSLTLIFVSAISCGQGTGLVLSGGGAKGLAHIGVIRALEESNIQIDYVAGTSMGAIVGSLYAMGYSADEMEKLVTSEEFIRWSTGTIDPRYRFNYKRTEDDASMFTIGIKREKDGTRPNIPAHLVPSGVIDFAFLELTSGANAVSGNNFDSLMIPFRCIASDVYNKEAVVMRRGNLGHAVKASMSYPLYFEPVIIDSVLLFDGGIYNNFPFDVLVEDFNPDFIIGSKVANRTPKPGKDDLMLQLENMIMQETNYVIPDSVGLVIEMKFENVSLMDFQMADSLINDGYRKTKKYISQILPHVKTTSQELLEERRLRYRQSLPDTLFENIFISGVSDRQEQYITNLISKQEKTFDIEQLKREYFKLLSEENIARSFPEARYNPERGTFDLLLDVELKDTYSLSAGGLISLSTYNQVFMGFNYYSLSDIFNMFSANVYLGQYYSSFNIAHRIVVPQRKSLIVDFSLTGNRWNYFTNEAPRLFSANSPSYAVRNERSFRAGIGFPAGNNSIFRTALSFCWIDDDYYQVANYQAETNPDKSEYFYAGARAGFEGNTLNRRQFATGGNKFSADISYHTGFEFFSEGLTDTVFDPVEWTDQQGWFTVRIRNENYNSAGRKFVIGSLVDINLSNMKTGNNYKSTLINAYKFEPTLFSKQLFGRFMRSNSYIGLGLMPVLEYSKDLNIRGGAYLFAPVRDIVDDPSGVKYGDYFAELRGAAELAIVYHSPVGPFSAGLNYFSHENNKVFYFLNFGYILFNSKGLD